MQNNYPTILTIAGSDSGGGAGIQADIKTITCLDAFGISAITALTAQNGLGVDGIFPSSPDFLQLQLHSLFSGFTPKAGKTGMLLSSELIKLTAQELEFYFATKEPFPLVVDPVCVSTSGHKLLEDSAIESLKNFMIPLATLLTPNKPEAECLTGISINSYEEVIEAGKKLLEMGAKNVLIKGGHFENNAIMMTDYLISQNSDGIQVKKLNQPHIDTENTHGTGCTLSAAIATYLGHQFPLEVAVSKAQSYLNAALRKSFAAGLGHGCPCFKV